MRLVSIEPLGAFRTAEHNLVSADWPFRSRSRSPRSRPRDSRWHVTPPLLGRYLIPTDERQGASPVLVIGHQAWQSHFGGDPQIVGKAINLDGVQHTVVGVMPGDFKFPVDHQFWIPLRTKSRDNERLQGPALHVFGRLAPDVTLPEAQAEMTLWASAPPSEYPETHRRLQPVVIPLHPCASRPHRSENRLGATYRSTSRRRTLVCRRGEPGDSVYARTVARLGEIAVRTALWARLVGASSVSCSSRPLRCRSSVRLPVWCWRRSPSAASSC